MERIHFPKATPILLNKLEGTPVLLLVFKEKDKPEDCLLDARFDMEAVAALANKGLLTGMIKMLNDCQSQLLQAKLDIEAKQRKLTEEIASKISIANA
jgi:hypothetical protein